MVKVNCPNCGRENEACFKFSYPFCHMACEGNGKDKIEKLEAENSGK